MLDIAVVWWWVKAVGNCLDDELEGRWEIEDVYKGYMLVAGQPTNGTSDWGWGHCGGLARERVARRRHCQWCHQQAEVRREEGPFLIRMRFAEVNNAERSRSFVIDSASFLYFDI
jgi:hypothetical protein